MSEKCRTFDAATADLEKGVNVVEASAGTGKTYAIAILVLRFVVEFDVAVDKILVVSYTRAATEELRSRVRSRLVEARGVLAGQGDEKMDPVLVSYLAGLSDKHLACTRLETALLDMDKAAIFTIHGFCQRMLREQALESGQLFDMELTADISQVKEELVADFWRNSMYALPLFHCSLFVSQFPSPESLYATVRGVGQEDRIDPDDGVAVADALVAVDSALVSLQDWWQDNSTDLKGHLEDGIQQNMFKKQFSDTFEQWWEQLVQFFSGHDQPLVSGIELLGPSGLMGQLNGNRLRGADKKRIFLEHYPLAGDELTRFIAACREAVCVWRVTLVRTLQTDLRKRLFEQGRFSFDDLILSLANALRGDGGEVLRQALGSRFRVALIDEFQDTDTAQYRIFSSLFGTNAKEHYLFLIGDPKQAIYKFRGADIEAYFQARRSADNLLGLEKNYRSNPYLVEAVNALFLQRDNADAFVNPELFYTRVGAARPPESWQLLQDETVQAAMVYCSLGSLGESGKKPKRWTSGKVREYLEPFVVGEVAKLLGAASLQVDVGEQRQLTAGDIAILVRSHKQAESFQESLSAAGIPAVILSRKTVFETRDCGDLLRVAEAVALPSDLCLLRSAMSSDWFGMNAQELYRQFSDDQAMNSWMERFLGYHALWEEKGILAMMNDLFAVESVFEHLCRVPFAERRISNIQHLVELLQERERRDNLHFFQTLQYLSSQMDNPEEFESAQLRLESDEQAVKVVTMHAVKGLEYPVVFCPYLWYRPGFLKGEKHCVFYHDEENNRVADLGSPHFEKRLQVALNEELAEEVRLLYVALTRASARCYTFWADVQGGKFSMDSKESALAWVLALEGCDGIHEQTDRFRELCEHPSVDLWSMDASAVEGPGEYLPGAVERAEFSCREFSRESLPAEWLMTSYSALAAHTHPVSLRGAAVMPREVKEDLQGTQIHSLPFGAGLGNVVHGLLEDYPFSLLAAEMDYGEKCLAQCRRFGVKAESLQLMALLRDVTRTPLPLGREGDTFCLSDLEERDVLKEMPFYFHLREGSTEYLNTVLDFSPVVQAVPERTLKGFLTGFIDLVCRFQEKYYVIDYKTNFLGNSLADYSAENLVAAMHGHNYGLQYWIYTLVLHRFLVATLDGYSYEKDFGGVFYLFARGMRPECPGSGVFFDRPELSVLEKLSECMGAK